MSNRSVQEETRSLQDVYGVQKALRPGMDNQDASAHMLALDPVVFRDANPAPKTCRHFRNQVPREIADELRELDAEPCHLCDAMPHRRNTGIDSFAEYSSI